MRETTASLNFTRFSGTDTGVMSPSILYLIARLSRRGSMCMSVALSASARVMISFTNFMMAAFSSSWVSPSDMSEKSSASLPSSDSAPTPKLSEIFPSTAE